MLHFNHYQVAGRLDRMWVLASKQFEIAYIQDNLGEEILAGGILRAAATLSCCVCLTACGSTLPIQDIRHPDSNEFADFVQHVALHVRCELRRALKANIGKDQRLIKMTQKWAAKIALNIKAIDEGAAGPNVIGMPNPSFLFTAAGSYKADATREMTMTYFLTVKELLEEQSPADDPDINPVTQLPNPCQSADDGFAPIGGDLGIAETMQAAFTSTYSVHSLSDVIKDGPFDTISHHVNFTVVAGATATPTWKLMRVSANTTGTLLSANRTSYDDLLLTIGPTQLDKRKLLNGPIPSGTSELDQSFFAERIRTIFSTPRPSL
ncbi:MULTISPECIES: hypothetical protein [Methylobacterium]|uniref:hypothetical protein n=1 Tax=Methylobacterium TaxID=407 RepID=UPI002F353429